MNCEAILFGIYDHRTDQSIPFGFALKSEDSYAVYHRQDVDKWDLTPTFEFVTRNLAETIITQLVEAERKSSIGDLHRWLLDHIFDGLGSFRCWTPIRDEADTLDAFVWGVMRLVDGRLDGYKDSLAEFTHSWGRKPDPPQVAMPDLVSA